MRGAVPDAWSSNRESLVTTVESLMEGTNRRLLPIESSDCPSTKIIRKMAAPVGGITFIIIVRCRTSEKYLGSPALSALMAALAAQGEGQF